MVKNLYVGNLSWDAVEEDVIELFEAVGKVKAVNIIKDKETKRSRGFCFLEMENGDMAISRFNGYGFMGRDLTVNEARPREERKGTYSAGGDSPRSYRR